MAARRSKKTEVHATTSSANRSRVKLFVAPECAACAEAKQILDQAGVKYSTVVVHNDEIALPTDTTAARKLEAQRFALPRLMIGPHQIGSLDRIKELHAQGQLLRVLDQA